MIYKGGIVRDPGDAEVANMSLSNSPGDLLFGPSFLPLVMYYLGIYQFCKVHIYVRFAKEINLTLSFIVFHSETRVCNCSSCLPRR